MNEHLKNSLIIASAAIPSIGGPLSVFLDKYLPNKLEERKIDFINTLIKDFDKYSKVIKKDLINNEEFLNTFLIVIEKAMKENRREKLVAFRNILLNSAINKNSEFDEKSFYVRLVDEFNVDQIKILKLYYDNDIKGHCNFLKENSIYKELKKLWPNADDDYLFVCITELIRYRIIVSSEKNTKNKKSSIFSSFGLKFVKYILNPIDLNKG
jgi:hypothetical protein